MTEGVTQTILVGDPSGRLGNCLQAAVATILTLSLDEVPHFAEHDNWAQALVDFAHEHGYATVWTDGENRIPQLGLAFGPTVRSADIVHAVAVVGGQFWDPHPSRAGLTAVTTYVRWTPLADLGGEPS
jgi:hypothetical protein